MIIDKCVCVCVGVLVAKMTSGLSDTSLGKGREHDLDEEDAFLYGQPPEESNEPPRSPST